MKFMTSNFVQSFIFLNLFLSMPLLLFSANEMQRTVLFLGDSLTAGYGIDKNEAYPTLIQKKCKENNLSTRIINAGVSGSTTAGGLRRLNWYFRAHIDILVIALGGNDGLRGTDPKESFKNLQEIIDKARAKFPDIIIVLAGMMIPPNMGEEYSREFREIFPLLAAKSELYLIPFLLEGVGGIHELNLPDGIHPNEKGHQIIAENVWQIIQPLIDREPKPAH